MKKFYAVGNGGNYDWDYGSYNYAEAVEMAQAMAANHEYDGEEIRIAVIDTEYEVCDSVEIIRNGEC